MKKMGIEWYRFGQKKGSYLAREIAYRKIFVERLSAKIRYFGFLVRNYKYVGWTHYFSKEDIEDITSGLTKKLERVKGLKILIRQAGQTYEKACKDIKKFSLKDRISNKELSAYFDCFVHHNGLIESYVLCANLISRALALNVEKELSRIFPGKSEEEIKQIGMALAYNEKESVFLQRHKKLLKLAELCKDDKLKIEHMQSFIKEFGWMRMMFLIYEPLTFSEVENEIKGIKDPKKELAGIELTKEKNMQKKEDLLEEIKPKGRLMRMINLLKESSYVETEILRYFQRLQYSFYPLLSCIAKRLCLVYNQLIYCSIDEIKGSLNGSRNVLCAEELEKRDKEGFSMFVLDGKFSAGSEEKKNEEKEIEIVKGMCACPGKVIGKARIIFDIKESGKLEQGDILVTGMTTPNLVTVMRKAGAIVTNDGGITCHAAIVSRELNIPCVIGTRIATEVFKDGDIIEVDAEKGIIRKITKI